MTILNVSMPESLRQYVESQATQGNASAYIRHLIREDQKRHAQENTALLREYLQISARQLDTGDTADITAEAVLAAGKGRRNQTSTESRA